MLRKPPKYAKPDSGYWENVKKMKKDAEFENDAKEFLQKKVSESGTYKKWGKMK